MVDGVAQRGLPLFSEICLFATGKHALKNFHQPSFMNKPMANYAMHYGSLYVNELLYRLLNKENDCADLYLNYKQTITQLQSADIAKMDALGADFSYQLRWALRQFEQALFAHMGVMIDYQHDEQGRAIQANGQYEFVIERGFCPVATNALASQTLVMTGQALQALAQAITGKKAIDKDGLRYLGIIHRQMVDYLLGDKPLHSRQLWQDYQRLMYYKSIQTMGEADEQAIIGC